MRYGYGNSYVSPTKDQIVLALANVRRAYELYKPILVRLQTEEVEVKSWFGLRRKVVTKDKHILQANADSFMAYYTRALLMEYITPEEHTICEFVMNVPLIKQLEQWAVAEAVYLDESDHRELMFALKEEIE